MIPKFCLSVCLFDHQFGAGWPVECWCVVIFSDTQKLMWRLKRCIYLNSTIVTDCVEDGLVQLSGVLGHMNIYYDSVYARDIEIA